MAFIPVPDTLEVAVIGQHSNGEQIVNVWHLNKSGGTNTQDARDLLNNWQDHIVPFFANNYTLLEARFRDISVADGETGLIAPDPLKPVQGGSSQEAAPPGTCVLIHKNISGTAGNRSGRAYMSPISEGLHDENGVIDPTNLAAWDAQWALFYAGLDEFPHLVVPHRPAGSAVGSSSVVTSLTVDPVVASQRRRQR